MEQVRLMSIGEFAAAAGLSAKALRLYDEMGLLRPAEVDSRPVTGATGPTSSAGRGWWPGSAWPACPWPGSGWWSTHGRGPRPPS